MDACRIAGSVVLYNSRETVIDNIKTYIHQVEKLYVIDNSDQSDFSHVEQIKMLPKVQYISNNGNQGIAFALNVAAAQAIQDGFTYLLTMDDDSEAPPQLINVMSRFLAQYPLPNRIGILSVAHSKHQSGTKYKRVVFTMTSGNLVNLVLFQIVGRFDENLFIDYVDHEYCLRLKIKRFHVIELSNLFLNHSLGVVRKKENLISTIKYTSHSPVRLYYLVRNGVHITRKYFNREPKACLLLMWLTFKESMKSGLLEDQKSARNFYFWRALRNGWRGRLGKITDQKI